MEVWRLSHTRRWFIPRYVGRGKGRIAHEQHFHLIHLRDDVFRWRTDWANRRNLLKYSIYFFKSIGSWASWNIIKRCLPYSYSSFFLFSSHSSFPLSIYSWLPLLIFQYPSSMPSIEGFPLEHDLLLMKDWTSIIINYFSEPLFLIRAEKNPSLHFSCSLTAQNNERRLIKSRIHHPISSNSGLFSLTTDISFPFPWMDWFYCPNLRLLRGNLRWTDQISSREDDDESHWIHSSTIFFIHSSTKINSWFRWKRRFLLLGTQ